MGGSNNNNNNSSRKLPLTSSSSKSKAKGGSKASSSKGSGGGVHRSVNNNNSSKGKGGATAAAALSEPSSFHRTTAADRQERNAARGKNYDSIEDLDKALRASKGAKGTSAAAKSKAKSSTTTTTGRNPEPLIAKKEAPTATVVAKRFSFATPKEQDESNFYNHFLIHSLFRETDKIDEEFKLNGCMIRASSGLFDVRTSNHTLLGEKGREPRYPISMLTDTMFRSALAALAGARQVYESQNKSIRDHFMKSATSTTTAPGSDDRCGVVDVVDLGLPEEDMKLLAATTHCFNEAIPMNCNCDGASTSSSDVMTLADIHHRFRLLALIQGARLYLRSSEELFGITHNLLRGVPQQKEEEILWGSSVKKILLLKTAAKETKLRLDSALREVVEKLDLAQVTTIHRDAAASVRDVKGLELFHKDSSSNGIFVSRANQERSRFVNYILERSARREGLRMQLRSAKISNEIRQVTELQMIDDRHLNLWISADLLPSEFKFGVGQRSLVQEDLDIVVQNNSETVSIDLGKRPHLAAAILMGKVLPNISSLRQIDTLMEDLLAAHNDSAPGSGSSNSTAYTTSFPWCSTFKAIFVIPKALPSGGDESGGPGYLAAVVAIDS